jgi:hypothetical protein
VVASIGFCDLGIGLGVLLVSLGYLVRAIWFLPGRELVEATNSENVAPQRTECEWCRQMVASPNQPCAAIDREQLADMMPRITNARCKGALAAQGFVGDKN